MIWTWLVSDFIRIISVLCDEVKLDSVKRVQYLVVGKFKYKKFCNWFLKMVIKVIFFILDCHKMDSFLMINLQ